VNSHTAEHVTCIFCFIFPLRLRFAVIATDICKLTVNHFSLLQSENMEALVQMVVGPPEDVEDEKTRFKYVLLACCC